MVDLASFRGYSEEWPPFIVLISTQSLCSCAISIGGLYTFFLSDTDIVVFFTSHDIARRSHIAVSIYKVRHFLNNLIALKTIHLHLHVSVPTYGCKIQTVIPVVTI